MNEQDKQRVREEEEFRHIVRAELEKQKPPKSGMDKLWDGLNSAFFLWAASTVAVGLITHNYQRVTESAAKRTADQQMVRKLDYEIENRLRRFHETVTGAVDPFSCSSAIVTLAGRYDESSVLTEFKEVSLPTLLWELEARVPRKDVHDVQAARKALNGLRSVVNTDPKTLKNPTALRAAKAKLMSFMKSHFRRGTWDYI